MNESSSFLAFQTLSQVMKRRSVGECSRRDARSDGSDHAATVQIRRQCFYRSLVLWRPVLDSDENGGPGEAGKSPEYERGSHAVAKESVCRVRRNRTFWSSGVTTSVYTT